MGGVYAESGGILQKDIPMTFGSFEGGGRYGF